MTCRGGRRVVITGQGTINALGTNVSETLEAMREGRCGISELDFQDVDRLSIRIGGQVKGYDAEAQFNRQQIALYDRFTQFTLLAAREAIGQAGGLSFSGDLATRSGVVLGTSGGGMNTLDENYRSVYEDGKNRVHPFVVPKLMNNAAASHVSMEYNLKGGPSFTVATACASSNHAMGQAMQMIRHGGADVMITGGSEAMLCFGGIKAWEGLRVMSRDACRPFSANRNGMVQGEGGAAVFVFEDYDHARKRGGAEILAEVVGGFAMSSDASDIVMPSKQGGAARAIRGGAMQDGGALNPPEDICYVNAHGTGTAANDKTECAAVADAFGHHADDLMISSTKSMHGHLIGGTGAVELLACIMALREGGVIAPPTIGYEEPDPECALDVVPNVAREADCEAVLSNAFAFGGLNAVLACARWPEASFQRRQTEDAAPPLGGVFVFGCRCILLLGGQGRGGLQRIESRGKARQRNGQLHALVRRNGGHDGGGCDIARLEGRDIPPRAKAQLHDTALGGADAEGIFLAATAIHRKGQLFGQQGFQRGGHEGGTSHGLTAFGQAHDVDLGDRSAVGVLQQLVHLAGGVVAIRVVGAAAFPIAMDFCDIDLTGLAFSIGAHVQTADA